MRDAIRDRIQALRESEMALRRSERLLRLILDAGPTLIAYIDADHRCRWANNACAQWFGRAPEEIQGRHVRGILGEAAWHASKSNAERVFSGETFTSEEEVRFREGALRWVQTTYTPERGESGEVLGCVVHGTDISERKQMEDWLWQLNEQLENKSPAGPNG